MLRQTLVCKYLSESLFSVRLSIYPEGELLDHMVSSLFLEHTIKDKLSLKVFIYFISNSPYENDLNSLYNKGLYNPPTMSSVLTET